MNEDLASLLDRDVDKIQEWVDGLGVGEHTYWVCPFSISQHSGICSFNPYGDSDPVTGLVHRTCDLNLEESWNYSRVPQEGGRVQGGSRYVEG